MRAAARRAAFAILRQAWRLQHQAVPTLIDLQMAEELLQAASDLLEAARQLKKKRDQNRYRIRRGQMPDVKYSMWRHLLSLSGPDADGAWIRFAGISRSLFLELCAIARRLRADYRPRLDEDGAPIVRAGPGAPLKMGDDDAMGLALRYVFGQSETVGLMCCFFVASETINVKLDRGLEVLDWALRRHPDAKVRWPKLYEQVRDARIIAEHGPDKLPEGLCKKKPFFWVDGMAMRVLPGSNKEVERSMCGTKHKGPHVSCVFAFSPSGVIIWQNINLNGSINDTEAAEPLVKLLHNPSKTIKDGAGLADAAFRGTESGASECFLTPATAHCCTTLDQVGEALALAYWTLGKRQAVEWAIRTLRRTFRRLAVDMHSDEKRRGRILSICTRLHNLRVRNGARTQLGTVFWNASQVGSDAADEKRDVLAAAAASYEVYAADEDALLEAAMSDDFSDAAEAKFEALLEVAAAADEAEDAAADAAHLDEEVEEEEYEDEA